MNLEELMVAELKRYNGPVAIATLARMVYSSPKTLRPLLKKLIADGKVKAKAHQFGGRQVIRYEVV